MIPSMDCVAPRVCSRWDRFRQFVRCAAPRRLAETKLLGAFVLLLMLSLEIVLNFLAARAQARRIGDLLSERPT
jgi:hypothetical protein